MTEGQEWRPPPPPTAQQPPPPPPPPSEPLPPPPPEVLEGPYEFDVVGESFYREAFEHLRGRTGDFLATLVAEPENPYDPQAVGVFIQGKKVGHLDRDDAAKVCERVAARTERSGPCVVRARIGGGGEGRYGVKLWLPSPDEI